MFRDTFRRNSPPSMSVDQHQAADPFREADALLARKRGRASPTERKDSPREDPFAPTAGLRLGQGVIAAATWAGAWRTSLVPQGGEPAAANPKRVCFEAGRPAVYGLAQESEQASVSDDDASPSARTRVFLAGTPRPGLVSDSEGEDDDAGSSGGESAPPASRPAVVPRLDGDVTLLALRLDDLRLDNLRLVIPDGDGDAGHVRQSAPPSPSPRGQRQ